MTSNSFNISRVDIAVDIEDLNVSTVLGILNIRRIRNDTLNIYKGTIYAGSNPKIRIYDKPKEIKSKIKKGLAITDYEKGLLATGKDHTRFELQIKSPKMTLQDLKDNPFQLVSYFDRLEFIKLEANETSGVLQFLHRLINRRYRKQIEQLKDNSILEKIKTKFIENVTAWFAEKEPF